MSDELQLDLPLRKVADTDLGLRRGQPSGGCPPRFAVGRVAKPAFNGLPLGCPGRVDGAIPRNLGAELTDANFAVRGLTFPMRLLAVVDLQRRTRCNIWNERLR